MQLDAGVARAECENAVGKRRHHPPVGWRAGIGDEEIAALFDHWAVAVAIEDHVDRLLRKCANRVVVRVAAAHVAVDETDPHTIGGDDFLPSVAAPDFFGIVVAGDRIQRRDRFEEPDRQHVGEIAHVQDAANLRGPQSIFERARQRASEARKVGVGNQADRGHGVRVSTTEGNGTRSSARPSATGCRDCGGPSTSSG